MGFFKIVQLANSRWGREVWLVTEEKAKILVKNGFLVMYTQGAKKEWKRCHKRIYLESNIFKVLRRACAANKIVVKIKLWVPI